MPRSVLVVVIALTACYPQQGTSPADVVASINPTAVVAGSTFTLTLTATSTSEWDIDDLAFMAVRPPSGGYLFSSPTCAMGWAPPTPKAHEKTASWTCTIPDGAPNGHWIAQTRVYVEGLANRDLDIPFEVIGGSDDLVGPDVSVTVPPTVTRGSSFGFTVRVRDDHATVGLVGGNVITLLHSFRVDRMECPGAWTDIDATTREFTATCPVRPDQSLGIYDADGLQAFDIFGQWTLIDITTEVTP